MIIRVLFLGEGPSDSGIVPQIENLAARSGFELAITDPDLGRLPNPPGKGVAEKLRATVEIGGRYDLVVIHRDADRDGREARLTEITQAVADNAPNSCYTPVIPVRMTEAWLLTDESELRHVAGNPRGKCKLNLPPPRKVEAVPDPKKLLRDSLAMASELSGRKLSRFHERFSAHRRQLLERLDPDGPIGLVPSWRDFVADLEAGLRSAGEQPRR